MRNVSHKQSCISGKGPNKFFKKWGGGISKSSRPSCSRRVLEATPSGARPGKPGVHPASPCVACSWCVSKPACSPVLGGVTARSAQLPRQGARQPATATCPAVSTGMPTSTLWSWQLPRHSQAGYVPWVILASCWQGKEESRKAWAQRP